MKLPKILNNPKNCLRIGLGFGIAGAVLTGIGTYFAIKETEKFKAEISELKEKGEVIVAEDGTEVVEPVKPQTLGLKYAVWFGKIALYYGPAAASMVLAYFGIKRQYKILNERNIALVGAYTGLSAAFNKVKEAIIAKEGEEKWLEYRYGAEVKQITEKDEDGNKVKKNEVTVSEDAGIMDDNMIIFDEECSEFDREYSVDYNLSFLNQIQAILNNRLAGQKLIVLNDLFDMIGHKRTEEGACVGWDYEQGDGYVDLRIKQVKRKDEFGREVTVFLLDPNTDGVIIHRFDEID